MEEDRAVADLGPDLPADITSEAATEEKKPKRRFIGRRAADAKAAAKAQPQENGGGIEDSGVVQGAVTPLLQKLWCTHMLTDSSRPSPPTSTCPEQRTRRNLAR